jgi:MFS family permease
MIISYMISRGRNNTEKEDIAVGLAFGLTLGLLAGLVSGLVGGLAFGLLAGLVSGFLAGLTLGLLAGLAFGLLAGLAFGLLAGLAYIPLPFELHWIIIGIIILGEVFFWLDREMPKRKSLWFTARKKLENMAESGLLIVNAMNVWYVLNTYWNYDEFLKWVGYIGMIVIVIAVMMAVIYGWLEINHLKYRKVKKE